MSSWCMIDWFGFSLKYLNSAPENDGTKLSNKLTKRHRAETQQKPSVLLLTWHIISLWDDYLHIVSRRHDTICKETVADQVNDASLQTQIRGSSFQIVHAQPTWLRTDLSSIRRVYYSFFFQQCYHAKRNFIDRWK